MSFFPIDDITREYDEDKVDEMIQRILQDTDVSDPPFLSNILIHIGENAVVQLCEALASGSYTFKWKIQALRGEFGEDIKPGDFVVRNMPINRVKRDGDLVTPRTMSKAKRDGSFKRKYEREKKFLVDEKGCFTCGYDDAVYFLNNWGYNKKTKSAVTSKPEYSHEPVDIRDPSKGVKKHVRNWRYAEMDKHDYVNLPNKKGK